MARRICSARDEGNKQVQAGTGMWILIDSEELRTQGMPSPNKSSPTPERHLVFSQCSGCLPHRHSVTQMHQVWPQRTAQGGAARPLGDTFDLGNTVSLPDLRTCCNCLALCVLALLETPLKLVPPPGFLLQPHPGPCEDLRCHPTKHG
jgi:hypothetical protein